MKAHEYLEQAASEMQDRGLSVEYLRSALSYDPKTGDFTWKFRADMPLNWNARFSGKRACTSKESKGYLQGKVNGKKYMAHRMAWAIYYGEWPKNQIDHINMYKEDNRICNLRAATLSENKMNSARYSNNKSGLKGVSLHKQTGKWRSCIFKDGRQIYLGLFSTKEDAHNAFCEASKEVHGEFHRNE